MTRSSSNKAAALIAALTPLAFLLESGAPLLLANRENLASQFAAAGPLIWVAVGSAVVAALVNSVLLFLTGQRARIPAFIPILLAGLPWIAGLVAMMVGLRAGADAVSPLNPDDKGTIAAAALSEALNGRAFGGWFASAQLAAAGVGLAIAALAQGTPGRTLRGLAFGAFAIPTIALGLMGIVAMGPGPGSALILLPALALAVALGLGGFSADKVDDERLASAIIGAGLSAAAAFAAMSASAVAGASSAVFEAIANVSPVDKPGLVNHMSEVLEAEGLLRFGWYSALVGGMVLAAMILRRTSRVAPMIAGAVLSLIVSVGLVWADALASRSGVLQLSDAAQPGFPVGQARLAQVPALFEVTGFHALVRADDTVLFPDGTSASLSERTRIVELLARSHGDSPALVERAIGEPFHGVVTTLALEQGVTTGTLNRALEACREAGFRTVGLAGASSASTEIHPAVVEAIPFASALATSLGEVRVLTSHATPSEPEETSPQWTARIDASRRLKVKTQNGSEPAQFELELPKGPDDLSSHWKEAEGILSSQTLGETVHLTVPDAVPLQDVLIAARMLLELEYAPVVHHEHPVSGELP